MELNLRQEGYFGLRVKEWSSSAGKEGLDGKAESKKTRKAARGGLGTSSR